MASRPRVPSLKTARLEANLSDPCSRWPRHCRLRWLWPGDESRIRRARPGDVTWRGRSAGAAASLHDDLVTPAPRRATTGDHSSARSSGGGGPEPKVFYLRYADGTETHNGNYDACRAPARCPSSSARSRPRSLECQRQIQAYLDAWYADFNIIFTLTQPTSGKYYTEVVSSGGGAWCKVDDKVAGVAPFLCKDLQGGRRVHVPGRPQRAGDRRHHRAGAGAPARVSSTRSTRTTSCSRPSAPTQRASSTRTAASPATAAIATSRTRTR